MIARLAGEIRGALTVLQDQHAVTVLPSDHRTRGARTERPLRHAGLVLQQRTERPIGLQIQLLSRQHGCRLVGLEGIAWRRAYGDGFGIVEIVLQHELQRRHRARERNLVSHGQEARHARPDVDDARRGHGQDEGAILVGHHDGAALFESDGDAGQRRPRLARDDGAAHLVRRRLRRCETWKQGDDQQQREDTTGPRTPHGRRSNARAHHEANTPRRAMNDHRERVRHGDPPVPATATRHQKPVFEDEGANGRRDAGQARAGGARAGRPARTAARGAAARESLQLTADLPGATRVATDSRHPMLTDEAA